MESLLLTGFVADRAPQDNFAFPPEIRAVVRELTGFFKKKEKWMVGAAAFLLLRERGESEVRRLVGMVNDANFHKRLSELVKSAASGEFGEAEDDQSPARVGSSQQRGGRGSAPPKPGSAPEAPRRGDGAVKPGGKSK